MRLFRIEKDRNQNEGDALVVSTRLIVSTVSIARESFHARCRHVKLTCHRTRVTSPGVYFLEKGPPLSELKPEKRFCHERAPPRLTRLRAPPHRKRVIRTDDAKILANAFIGRFDNNAQVLEESQRGATPTHARLHTLIVPVSVPALPVELLFERQYTRDDPTNVVRERVFALSYEGKGKRVRMDIPKVRDLACFGDVVANPAALAKVSENGFELLKGCSIGIQKEDGSAAWHGRTRDGEGHIKTQSGAQFDVRTTLDLSPGTLSVYDEAYDTLGKRVWGSDVKNPYPLERARELTCWGALKTREGEWLPAVLTQLTHDQGVGGTHSARAGRHLRGCIETASYACTSSRRDFNLVMTM